MTIPYRERYSIERGTLVVHERYQDHAPDAHRTTALGVQNIAGVGELVPCPRCFPPPPVPRRASGGVVRPGRMVVVGDTGPELVYPTSDYPGEPDPAPLEETLRESEADAT